MKKWYICTLIAAFAFLGYTSKEQSALPNQKMVLQFSDNTVTSNEAQNAIAIVKEQLQDFGANNIKIQELEAGQLKITYYSKVDVASIKEIFSKENNLAITYAANETDTEFPSKKNSLSYNLDVFKIHDTNDTESGLDGNLVLELRPETDRYFNPNVHFSSFDIDNTRIHAFAHVANKVNRNIAIAIDNTSYKIPEVRAGPITNKTS